MDVKIRFEAPKGARDPFVNRYPFAQMQVGDAMLIPKPVPIQNVKMAAHAWGKKRGRKFEHQVIDGANVIVRVA